VYHQVLDDAMTHAWHAFGLDFPLKVKLPEPEK
jgi:hypothetical protein